MNDDRRSTAEDRARVLGAIDRDELLGLAKALIRIPSFTTRETPAAEMLVDYLQRRGFEAWTQEVEPGRKQALGRLPGRGGGASLMFNGHLDIDPLGANWRHDPWEPVLEDGKLYGAGVYNMKGGVASMVAAADALRRSGVALAGDVLIAGVVGELQGGVGTSYLMEHGPRADAAVVPEPYGNDVLLTVHGGVAQYAVHVYGRSAHISRKEDGIDALDKMVEVVRALRGVRFTFEPSELLPDLPRMLVGSIVGGRGSDHDLRGPYGVCDHCTILIDVRFVPGQTPEGIRDDIDQALEGVRAADPELRYEIELPPHPRYEAQRISFQPTIMPTDTYVVQAVARHATDLAGRPPRVVGASPPLSYTGNDTAHLWRAGIPGVLYGPAGGREGGADVFTVFDEMVRCAEVLALTALDVCSQPPELVARRGAADPA